VAQTLLWDGRPAAVSSTGPMNVPGAVSSRIQRADTERLREAQQIALDLTFGAAAGHDELQVTAVPTQTAIRWMALLVEARRRLQARCAHDRLLGADILLFADDADRSKVEVEGLA
jgi:hypothetical protein